MARLIEGAVFVIDGDVHSDAILAPRHLADADPAALARNCFADLASSTPFEPGRYAIVIATGLFGIGLVRPPVPLALRAAGIEALLAPALSPLLVEHGLNSGAVLPLQATLPHRPPAGSVARLGLDGNAAELSWDGGQIRFACRLPAWALAGEPWVEAMRRRAEQAGGLAALQSSLRAG